MVETTNGMKDHNRDEEDIDLRHLLTRLLCCERVWGAEGSRSPAGGELVPHGDGEGMNAFSWFPRSSCKGAISPFPVQPTYTSLILSDRIDLLEARASLFESQLDRTCVGSIKYFCRLRHIVHQHRSSSTAANSSSISGKLSSDSAITSKARTLTPVKLKHANFITKLRMEFCKVPPLESTIFTAPTVSRQEMDERCLPRVHFNARLSEADVA
ncbi:hypothetical protein C0J52_14204 [Blattella germanica]|nr:hypothetical protein C0J52_14204 [Blattella germanica]